MPETVINTSPDTSPLMLLIGRMDGKLDALLTADKKQDARIDALDVRLSALERWRAAQVAITGLLSGAASFAVEHFWR